MEDSTLVEAIGSVKLSNSERRRSVSEEFKSITSRIEPIREEDGNCTLPESINQPIILSTESKQGKQIKTTPTVHQKAELNSFKDDNFHHKVSHDYFETVNNEQQQQRESRLIKLMKAGITHVKIQQGSAQSVGGMVSLASNKDRQTSELTPDQHYQDQGQTPSPRTNENMNEEFNEDSESFRLQTDNRMVSPSQNLSHQPLKQQDSEPMLLDDLDEEQLKRYLAYKRLSEGCNRLNTTFTRKNSLHMVDELPPLTEGETMKHMSYHLSQNIESTASSSSSSSLRSNRQQTLRDLALKRGSQDENTSCSSSTSLERSPSRRRSSTVSQCSSVLSEGTRNQLNFDLSPDLPLDSSILEANAISPTDLDRPASPEPSSFSGDTFDFRPISRLSNEEPMLASPDSTLGDSNDEEISEEKLKRLTQSYPAIYDTHKTSITSRDSDNIGSNSEIVQKNIDENNN